jgi:hypothetical protein
MHYGSLQTPVSIMTDQHHQQPQQQRYQPQQVFQTPPQNSLPGSPDTYGQDQYGQQNLADLLGELKMNEAGTGMVLPLARKIIALTRIKLHI